MLLKDRQNLEAEKTGGGGGREPGRIVGGRGTGEIRAGSGRAIQNGNVIY